MLAAASAALPVSSAFAESPEKPKVALVMKSLANEFFLTMEDGAKAYQKEHSADFDLISNGIKDETDTAGQTRIVEQMILAKVNALVIAPSDSKAMVPVIKKAVDAGITVINIDNQLDPQIVKSKNISVPFVGPDNRKGARLVGEYLAKQLKAGDEVGIIEGVSTTTNAQQRTAGFKDAMDAAQIKVVSLQSGDWEIDKGNKVAASILSEYPDVKALLAVTTAWPWALFPLCALPARRARYKWSATTISTRSSRCSRTVACWRRPTSSLPSRRCSVLRPR
jgi:ribose transport system substrate-binding protein